MNPHKERTFSLSQYPLAWPEGWARTSIYHRKHSHFKRDRSTINVEQAVRRVTEELGKIGVKRDDMLISTNCRTRLDGLPRGDESPADPGVALYWRKKPDAPMQCMAIDMYRTVAGNIGAIAATLEAMRAIERHGGAQVQERSFRGFAALPAKASQAWREVLGVPEGLVTRETIELAFKKKALLYHPDRGGDRNVFEQVAQARTDALKEIAA